MKIDREQTIGYWSKVDRQFHATVYGEHDNDGAILHLEIDAVFDDGWDWRKTLCHGATVRVRGNDEFFENVKDLKSRGEWFWDEQIEAECERARQLDRLLPCDPVDEFDPTDTRI